MYAIDDIDCLRRRGWEDSEMWEDLVGGEDGEREG